MKNPFPLIYFIAISMLLSFTQCIQNQVDNQTAQVADKPDFNGYESQAAWGEHLVIVSGCNDCHTPKKMTAHGPELDSALLLSGHPSQLPSPDINRKEIESKGLIVTQDLTAWVGPWGISYAANITSDASGIGNWQEVILLLP